VYVPIRHSKEEGDDVCLALQRSREQDVISYTVWITEIVSARLMLQKQTPWPLVRKRTIPTERPPLVDEI
jgi:hypothetical protein